MQDKMNEQFRQHQQNADSPADDNKSTQQKEPIGEYIDFEEIK